MVARFGKERFGEGDGISLSHEQRETQARWSNSGAHLTNRYLVGTPIRSLIIDPAHSPTTKRFQSSLSVVSTLHFLDRMARWRLKMQIVRLFSRAALFPLLIKSLSLSKSLTDA